MSVVSILIVDNDEKVGYSLAKILEKESYLVRTAGCGQIALAKLNADPINLVLLDLDLPDFQAVSFIAKIREEHPDLPVLVLTATPTHDAGADAARLGVREYLMKPIDPVDLLSRIRGALAKPPL